MTVDAGFRTPYDIIDDAGYGHLKAVVEELLDGDEWYNVAPQSAPKTIAAGAVYYLHKSNDNMEAKTQAKLAEDFDTTPMSVRNGWQAIGKHHGLLGDEDA